MAHERFTYICSSRLLDITEKDVIEKESLAGFMRHTSKSADRFYKLSQTGVIAGCSAPQPSHAG